MLFVESWISVACSMFMDVLLNGFTVGETVSTSMDKNAKMMIMNHDEEEQTYKNKSDDADDHYNDDNDDGGDGQLK